jgi:hypothetical protein
VVKSLPAVLQAFGFALAARKPGSAPAFGFRFFAFLVDQRRFK